MTRTVCPNIRRKENDKNSVSQFQQKGKRQGTVCPNTSRNGNDKVQYVPILGERKMTRYSICPNIRRKENDKVQYVPILAERKMTRYSMSQY